MSRRRRHRPSRRLAAVARRAEPAASSDLPPAQLVTRDRRTACFSTNKVMLIKRSQVMASAFMFSSRFLHDFFIQDQHGPPKRVQGSSVQVVQGPRSHSLTNIPVLLRIGAKTLIFIFSSRFFYDFFGSFQVASK
jgi:hypothetical protein